MIVERQRLQVAAGRIRAHTCRSAEQNSHLPDDLRPGAEETAEKSQLRTEALMVGRDVRGLQPGKDKIVLEDAIEGSEEGESGAEALEDADKVCGRVSRGD